MSTHEVIRLALDVAKDKPWSGGEFGALLAVRKLLEPRRAHLIEMALMQMRVDYEVATKQAYATIETARKQRDKSYAALVEALRREQAGES